MNVVSKFKTLLEACIVKAPEVTGIEKGFAALVEAAGNALRDQSEDALRAPLGEVFLFGENSDIRQMTNECVDYIRGWHVMGDAPSLAALCASAAEYFEIQSPVNLSILAMAAILGEAQNEVSYHNNRHFKKVLVQAIRMIGMHNTIYGDTSKALNEDEITLILTAACIHDIGHDGLGNTVKGVFHASRLEQQSLDLAMPYLKEAGLQEAGVKALIAMVIATDVSPLNDPSSPMGQMKAAYRYHYLGEDQKFDRLNLSPSLKPLETDKKLTLMACILHEADIATSAGLDYKVTQFETILLRDEMGRHDACPEHILGFLDVICQRRFLSDAGQKLYAANLARIYALAEEDFKDGNQPYPKAQHTDFILTLAQSKNSDPKTLN